MLQQSGRKDIQAEIVFPVSPESITTGNQTTANNGGPVTLPGGLSVIPGPASGEGCSTEGGCASCPYMKMNSLRWGAVLNIAIFTAALGFGIIAFHTKHVRAGSAGPARYLLKQPTVCSSLSCQPCLHPIITSVLSCNSLSA